MAYNNLHKGIDDLKKTSLSKTEKGAMLSELLEYAESHPIPTRTIKSSWYTIFTVYTRQYRSAYMAATLIALLIIGGNISYAAEQSLPGDLLYPVKLRVNEKVADVLQFTPEAKVKWEETKVEKRLKEAEVLIERGTFDTPKRIQIEGEVQKNVENLQKQNKSDSERVKGMYVRFKNKYNNDKREIVPTRVIATTTPDTGRPNRIRGNNRNLNFQATTTVIIKAPEIRQESKDMTDKEIKQKEEVQKFELKIQETFKDSLRDKKDGRINIDMRGRGGSNR